MALVLPEPVRETFFAVYATDISIADVVLQSITAEVEATFIVLLIPSVLLKLRYWPSVTGTYPIELAASLCLSVTTTIKFSSAFAADMGVPVSVKVSVPLKANVTTPPESVVRFFVDL